MMCVMWCVCVPRFGGFRDISLKITNVNLVLLEKKSLGIVLWGSRISVQNVMAIYLIGMEIIQSETQPTNQSTLPSIASCHQLVWDNGIRSLCFQHREDFKLVKLTNNIQREMEKKWKLNLHQMSDLAWWMVIDGRRVNDDTTEGLSLGETPEINWRLDSVRISSPPFFTGGTPYFYGHFPTLLWHFIPPYPLHTHARTHISCLALSFPLRYLASLSVRSKIWHLSISLCLPLSGLPLTRLVAWQSMCVPLWGMTVRYWSLSTNLPPWVHSCL